MDTSLPRTARAASGAALQPADVAKHQAIGIDADLLVRAQIRRVDDRAGRALLGLNGKPGDFAGVEYPYLDPRRPDARWTSRLRLDAPPVGPDGKPDGKYRSPYGDNRHLYFPPGAGALLQQPDVPVVFVEAEKSALAVTAAAERAGRPLLTVGLGGCNNWRGRIGKTEDARGRRVDEKGPLPDFQLIALKSRAVYVLFDARPNESVKAASRQFARCLRGWGARVHHAHLPDDDPRVNGPDDLIGALGDAAFWRVIDDARVDDFTRSNDGRIVAGNLDNIRLALARLGRRVEFDAFANVIRLDGAPLEDVDVERLWLQIDDTFHFRPSKDTLRTVMVGAAHDHVAHPPRTYLNGLRWDGRPRLDSWLSVYGGAANTPYSRAVGAITLIAGVRRVRQPGTKFDELLILESPQGTFKSSAIAALCPDPAWFSDDLPLGVDSKQVIERTAGKWIIEAAELHGNRGREAEALKAFLSRQVDGPVRLAYGRLPTSVPRQFILIGTTNARLAYLKDSTGARRFWPVAIERFDVAALTRDRDQLWAEAAVREAQGASIRLDPALWSEAAAAQEDRRAGDPWEAILEPLLEGDGLVRVDQVTVTDIWAALKLEANHLDNRHADRVAAIVQRHGFTGKQRRRVAGKPAWCWVKAETSDVP